MRLHRALCAVFGLFLLLSCGKAKEPVRGPKVPYVDPDPPITDIPAVLELSGALDSTSKVETQDLTTSALVKFHAKAAVALSPDIPRLAKMIRIADRESIRWRLPESQECPVQQVEVEASTVMGELQLEVTSWAWVFPGQTKACETLYRQVQERGLEVILGNVPVRRSQPVPEVHITLQGSQN